jgi:hypothetical protein
MSERIELTRGKFALIDDDDYDEISKHKWHLYSNRYAARSIRVDGKNIFILMHRVIMDAPKHLEVDHINGNGLDNRKENMRLCTHLQNTWNRTKKTGTHRYKGAVFHKRVGKWYAYIKISKKCVHLGVFLDEKDAARAYNNAAIENFGEFACLNVIDEV